MASFILLQQLGPFALQRSRTVLVFYAFIVTDVLRPIMAAKRPIVVEGNTPGKPENKQQSTEGRFKRSLFRKRNIPTKASGRKEWTKAETSALVQYIG